MDSCATNRNINGLLTVQQTYSLRGLIDRLADVGALGQAHQVREPRLIGESRTDLAL